MISLAMAPELRTSAAPSMTKLAPKFFMFSNPFSYQRGFHVCDRGRAFCLIGLIAGGAIISLPRVTYEKCKFTFYTPLVRTEERLRLLRHHDIRDRTSCL